MAEPLSFAHSGFSGRIGVAREDITPPVGIYARSWGAASHDVGEGIHRPLTATALTLQTDADSLPLVLIAADLSWWRTREDERFVREGVLEALGVPTSHVIINASHTHSGPSISRDELDKPGGDLIPAYLERLREAFVAVARRALECAEPAVLEWTEGRCTLAHHRDVRDPIAPRVLCGFDPKGTADNTLLVGRATALTGRPLATVVNYACHPVTLAWGNRLISPDFVGAFRETTEAHSGGALALFLQGASGELAAREHYSADTDLADRQGRVLGYATLSALEEMTPPMTGMEYAGVVESGAPLATWRQVPRTYSTELAAVERDIVFPLQESLPSVEELDIALERETDRVLAERILRKRRLRKAVGAGTTTSMPLWAWRIGDALLVGQPNEAYSPFQTELRRCFAPTPVVVMNLVNGHTGYIPPDALYDEDIYQVWQTPLGRGSLGKLIAESEAILWALVTGC